MYNITGILVYMEICFARYVSRFAFDIPVYTIDFYVCIPNLSEVSLMINFEF